MFTPSYDVTPLSAVQKKSRPQPVDDRVDQTLNHARPVAPRKVVVDDEQRSEAMYGGPGGARRDVRINFSKLLRLHALGDGVAQGGEGAHAARLSGHHRLLPPRVQIGRRRQDERGQVMIGVFQTEGDVALHPFAQAYQRVWILGGERFELTHQLGEALLAQAGHELLFVFEVEIDGGGRVIDAFRDLPHRELIVAVVDQQLPGSVENVLPEELLLSGAAVFDAHGLYGVILLNTV